MIDYPIGTTRARSDVQMLQRNVRDSLGEELVEGFLWRPPLTAGIYLRRQDAPDAHHTGGEFERKALAKIERRSPSNP